jgi:hypothetical protein
VINVKNPGSETFAGIFIQANPASINVASGGKIAILGNGASVITDTHLFATNTDNIWNDGAIFEWNCSVDVPTISGITYFPNANAVTVPIFRITSVGGEGILTAGSTFTLNGLLDLSTGVSITFNGNGSKNFRDGVSGTSSTIIFSDGTTSIVSVTAILSGTSVGLYGAVAYSEIAKVKVVKGTPGMYIFPNPITDNNIQLQINQPAQGKYKVRLLNAAGQLLLQQTVSHTGINATHIIQPEHKLAAGTYQLQVINPAGKKQVLSIIVQ